MAMHTCFTHCQEYVFMVLTATLPVNSPPSFSVPLLTSYANAVSHVGPLNIKLVTLLIVTSD